MREFDAPADGLIRRDLQATTRGSGIVSLTRSVWRNRSLVNELARREIADVHAGQAGGTVWALLHPLIYFIVFAFLFTTVFKVRIGNGGPADYMVYLFAGLAPWLMTQDILARASTIMVQNATIVKKVMFPTEALVAKSLLASIRVQSVLLFVVIITFVSIRGSIPISFLLLPPLLALHLALVWGLSLLLSVITPYFRDVSELVRVFLLINIYLVPIMYLPEMVPDALRFALVVNPFSHLVWCYQDVFYFTAVQHPISWVITAIFAAVALAGGSYVFTRLKHHLASVV